jgi:hypothetical protein
LAPSTRRTAAILLAWKSNSNLICLYWG